eukprot:TRINITY_DN4427_c0_g1_i1.p2 TRINITY_DN4427_c0_g1~~TRINITY_DN4427_c0_g1_i1.p2  ORF type:complete len:52 (+),score=7.42 TRINITY_DN4427_c0_g1_i1:235-390(+)
MCTNPIVGDSFTIVKIIAHRETPLFGGKNMLQVEEERFYYELDCMVLISDC